MTRRAEARQGGGCHAEKPSGGGAPGPRPRAPPARPARAGEVRRIPVTFAPGTQGATLEGSLRGRRQHRVQPRRAGWPDDDRGAARPQHQRQFQHPRPGIRHRPVHGRGVWRDEGSRARFRRAAPMSSRSSWCAPPPAERAGRRLHPGPHRRSRPAALGHRPASAAKPRPARAAAAVLSYRSKAIISQMTSSASWAHCGARGPPSFPK